MSQRLIQDQQQGLRQIQKITQQQMLQIHLLEMPLAEFEDAIKAEMDDNPYLEQGDRVVSPGDESLETNSNNDEYELDPDKIAEQNDRDQAFADALKNIGGDDVMLNMSGSESYREADNEERTYGSNDSFYDVLKEQMNMCMLNDDEKDIMEYLIGSLDNDGLLRSSIDNIIDELAIYNEIEVTPEEMNRLISILQDFDPAGIGARDLRECLLIQIKRKEQNNITRLMYKVISEYYDDFVNNHKEKIFRQLNLSEDIAQTVFLELKKLNPRPGAALGETQGNKMQQVTPDFIIDTDGDGNVSFTINTGMVPELFVSQEYTDKIQEYLVKKDSMSRSQKEELLYIKQKVDKARGFIDAVKQRRHTLYVTMKAIIDIQKKYFQDGDEADIKPMILKDVADKTGLDISTISRVSNQKYAQTRWGMFKLRHFFSGGYVTGSGKELPTRKIKMALQDIINGEDKKKPLTDEELSDLMKNKGFAIARRTIAKYRKQLRIPTARFRKV